METAGLAVGIFSLYSTFLEVLKHVDSYKSFGTDVTILFNRYEASKLKLQKWADMVGVRDNQLVAPHDPRLDDPRVASVIRNILRCLTEIFDKTEYTNNSIGLSTGPRLAEANGWATSDEAAPMKSEQPLPSSRRSRLAWAMGRRDRFTKDICNFEGLVNILCDIVPPLVARAESLNDCITTTQKVVSHPIY